MTLRVRVIPNAKKIRIEEAAGVLRVYLGACPQDGKANKQLIKVLAQHYRKPKSTIAIIQGKKSRDKLVEILDL